MNSRPRNRLKSWHYLSMTLEDTADFEAAVRKEFPAIRILRSSLNYKWDETWKWRPILFEHRKYNEKYRTNRWEPPSYMRNPGDDPLVYRDSLTYPWDDWYFLWLEPENWKPKWEKVEDSWFYELSNMPPLAFEFRRSGFRSFCLSGQQPRDLYLKGRIDKSRPPDETWDDEVVVMDPGAIWANWKPGDAKAKAFSQKIFRIAKKLMSNRFRAVDDETLLPFRKSTTSELHHWAGHHAMTWAAERRHNYLVGYYKPPDYDFGPDEPPA